MADTKFTILIVDDDRANLNILYRALIDTYTVIVANSGKLAIKKASENNPDLILMDIMMPDMSGYEALSELKSLEETRHIPVIFITGLNSAEDETKGLIRGAVDYITKPVHVGIMRARVKTHLQIVSQMRMIENIGMIDPLTKIANRRKFDQQFTIEWARAHREQKPISLLMFDLDKFKSYNDSYGHPMGDSLLQTFAKTLAEYAKRSADLPARIGGEEFSVLLPSTDLPGAIELAEGIRAAVEALAIPSGYNPELPVTTSVGVVSIIPGDNSTIADFVSLCDKNLYTAKNTGRNKVHY